MTPKQLEEWRARMAVADITDAILSALATAGTYDTPTAIDCIEKAADAATTAIRARIEAQP